MGYVLSFFPFCQSRGSLYREFIILILIFHLFLFLFYFVTSIYLSSQIKKFDCWYNITTSFLVTLICAIFLFDNIVVIFHVTKLIILFLLLLVRMVEIQNLVIFCNEFISEFFMQLWYGKKFRKKQTEWLGRGNKFLHFQLISAYTLPMVRNQLPFFLSFLMT